VALKLRILIVLLLGWSLCGAPNRLLGQEEAGGTGIQEDQVALAIDAAETARQRAAEAGYEWLQTGALIQDAREAFENGQFQQALSLAQQAEQQGQLAVEQALRESVAWRDRVIHWLQMLLESGNG